VDVSVKNRPYGMLQNNIYEMMYYICIGRPEISIYHSQFPIFGSACSQTIMYDQGPSKEVVFFCFFANESKEVVIDMVKG
jgi:hypothetical protein